MNPIRFNALAGLSWDIETIIAKAIDLGHEKCGATAENVSKPDQKKGG
jgi:hypothetical protein